MRSSTLLLQWNSTRGYTYELRLALVEKRPNETILEFQKV
jgi:hypothetical protein